MTQGIAYQNKDIEFKILSEAFPKRSFEAYGLKLPRVKAVLPTNLPSVSANELRMDNLFLLEDDTYALVDYESENRTKNRIKYVNYIARVVERLYREHGKVPSIRMIVVYTGDVEKAVSVFDMGCMALTMEQVFLIHVPSEELYQAISDKLEHGKLLTEQELMQLILLPLTEKGREGKQKRVRQVIQLARQLEDESEQKFVLAGLLLASDKFISREDAEGIRREIRMTKVGRLLVEEGIEKGMTEGKRVERAVAVHNLLKLHIPEGQILQMYSRDDLNAARKLQKEEVLE
ncbi:MAG: hypothetical protein HFI42_16195 [Lachnospiraceae bacterium]|nr:hypothetical protein [Lachnospiraceae bacterium]